MCLTSSCDVGQLDNQLFKTWYDAKLYSFCSSLNDFEVHSRSQHSRKQQLVRSFCCKVACRDADFPLFLAFFRYFWPDPFSIFSYLIFLFLNFLSLLCSFSVRRHKHVDFQLFSQKSNGIPVHEATQIFIIKLHETTQIFIMVDYVSEMTVKKSFKYGQYGSLEHLLFLFFQWTVEIRVLFAAYISI